MSKPLLPIFLSKALPVGLLTLMLGILQSIFIPAPGTAQSLLNTQNVIPVPTEKPIPGSPEALPQFSLTPSEEIFPNVQARLKLDARMGNQKTKIENGIIWRIFGEKVSTDGKLPLLATYSGGTAAFDLPAGYYLVHAAFGYASLTKRVKVLPPKTDSTFDLSAGGLRLNAAFREGDIIPASDVSFEVAQLEDDNLKTIVTDVKADELVRLSEGLYHVISRYGDINSVVSADVRVKAGELTELTLYQRGAEITLKLVSKRGGEALANTSWTVLTPGGDPVVSTIVSAFPNLVLAAGEYVAFALHEGENHSVSFTIESGVHRDVELVLELDE